MDRAPRVVEVEPLGGHRLRLRFSDDLVRELDFAGVLVGEAFADLADASRFAEVTVDPVAGTICWPGGIDLDPDVLHGDHVPVSGRAPEVIREYRLRPTA